MSLTVVIILIFIVAITNVIMSKVFKDTPKVDKGIKMFYFELSYRRKMIRSLITSPIFSVIVLTTIYYSTIFSATETFIVGLLLFALIIGELYYNFSMWKKSEN